MKRINLLKIIKSNDFALTVAIMSVLVQSFHSFTAFYNMSSLKGTFWGVIQAVLFAIVVDLAILFYTVRNKKDVVLFASTFLFVINAYYYYSHWGFTWELLFASFLSILIPVTHYYYSDEIKEEISSTEKEDVNFDLMVKVQELEGQNNILKKSYSSLQALFTKNKNLSNEYNIVIEHRDQLLSRNSLLSEALGLRTREIHDLKKRLGEIPPDEPIDIEAEEKRIEDEIIDKSLLNVSNDQRKTMPYNPINSDAPIK